jgi:hypothetical protein
MMRGKSLFLRLVYFVIAWSVETPAMASGPYEASPEVVELATSRARELYQQANTLFLAQKYALAYVLYKAAWDLRPNYKVAANLGSCEYELGKYRDSAEHLAFSLREQSENAPTAERTYVAERHASAIKQVAALEVNILNAGTADIFIDNRFVGRAPLIGAIYVEPGVHFIHARNKIASGYERVDAKKGESRKISLNILPTATLTTPSPDSTPTANIIVGVGGGLTAAFVGGGAYAAIMHYGNPRYAQPTKPLTSSDFVFAWGGLLAGGVLGVATISALFATTLKTAPRVRISANLSLEPGNWRVGVQATF